MGSCHEKQEIITKYMPAIFVRTTDEYGWTRIKPGICDYQCPSVVHLWFINILSCGRYPA